MRATSTPSPVRTGKRRLLTSCAIAAGMAALALGGPALAQVAGTGQVVTAPGLSGATISPPAPGAPANTTTVTTTGPQTIINWTPTDTAPAGAPIDFLPAGNTLNFFGTGQYTVLNRFISGAGAPLSRQIALNGTVNGYITSPAGVPPLQGGNIWFYNAGGILIGGGAAINVGSLVLTANDIDTNGGLFGPGGEIRFRGAAGSLSEVQVAQGAVINTLNVGNPGSSYVAMVAPRIVQRGRVTTDGSTAYVAAEQADIRINNGLFDINVIVGAEGGDVITHTGITNGPAHQQGDTNQNRVYMVAIPKNDAVTMLVSGQVGYDDAAVAQVDPDGAVRLSAGYNIVNGEIAATPASAVASNITVNDIVFRSNTIAHASGAFVGQPISQLPGPFLPAVPPPQQGRILVQGDGTFIGDASATLIVNPNRLVGATGNLTIQSGGANGVAGVTTVTVDGGQLAAGGDLSIQANGAADAAGNSIGGNASLTVSNAGVVGAVGNLTVAGNGVGAAGGAGSGTGGNASISVTGAGSQLTGATVAAQANGFAGAILADAGGGFTAPDQGGSGTGGSATISVQNGGSLSSANGTVSATATGAGQIGNVQSGNGTGGTARIDIAGTNTNFSAAATTVSADGFGAGSISDPVIGTILSQDGGDGRGGSATFSIGGDTSTVINPGDTSVNANGSGGDAGGVENATGGNAFGGTATVEAIGPVTATFPSLAVNAGAESGGASSPSALTGLTGNATGGTINITADNGAALTVNSGLQLSAGGAVVFGENLGSGLGGNVTVNAEDQGTIDISGTLEIDVTGGSFGNGVAQNAGTGTGGTVNLLAARDGALTAQRYDVDARGQTANVRGANGAAQGGFVNVAASAGGQIAGTDISLGSTINAGARSGVSAAGSVAGGGTIQLVATGGGIDLNATTFLLAGGTSGGALTPGSSSIGSGGVIQIQVVADPLDASAISFDTLQGNADGRTAVDVEAAPGIEESSGDGQGGTMLIDVAGGTFAANSINVSASGYGGGVGTASGTGRGGTAGYSQTAGVVTIGDMAISANGFGGFAPDVAGQGLGGNATIDLLGGTFTGTDIVASAVAVGGIGAAGNNLDPATVVPSGAGGDGQGGTATININGAVVVNTSSLSAIATGNGGTGGEFTAPFDTFPESGGAGGGGQGGTAAINVTSGTVTSGALRVDATGIGGEGGNVFGSSSSGAPAGVGVGGDGGQGRGGNATIDFATAATVAGSVDSASAGIGGNGGTGYSGGDGGLGIGGLAQVIVTDFDAGALAVTLDTGGFGGTGASGSNGSGGNGGDAIGGTSRFQATGSNGNAAVGNVNFITGGTGGAGGDGAIPLGATTPVAPRGGNGGTGEGGVLEVIASGGATVALDTGAGAAVVLGSRGNGGEGGVGSGAAYPDGSQGGDGGDGGGGIGGNVHLVADGGTITSSGNAVNITVDGTAGASGSAGNGTGTGAPGAGGAVGTTTGGRVTIEALSNLGNPGQIVFGNTTIAANGDSAGRIGFYANGGSIAMGSLSAEALGIAALTNLDTDVAPAGIFFGLGSGSVTTTGAVSLTTGSSIGVYAQGGGTLAAGGDLTMQADDEVDIRHDFRTGTAPTISSGGAMAITGGSSVRAQLGTLISAATSLSISTMFTNGSLNLDALSAGTTTQLSAANFVRANSTTSGEDLTASAFGVEIGNAVAGDDINLTGNFIALGTISTTGTGTDAGLDGSNIVLSSVAATTVTHAEADNDFIATVGSFQTGLNSIITGGDIIINSPGAVDLGNSTAGGFVSVDGQSIAFNAINAGTTVGLNATGTAAGAEGITGVDITSGGAITLTGDTIAITGTSRGTGAAPFSAIADGGNATFGVVDVAGSIQVGALGNIGGAFTAGGDIALAADGNIVAQANARGGYVTPGGVTTEGIVLIDADGNATVTNSSAATMFGVRAGQAASLNTVTAGEDMLVIGGTTATVNTVRAGDDLTITAPGGVTANNAATSGLGADNRTLSYGPSAAGVGNIFQVTTSAADLSNIVLTASAGNIGGNNVDAFDNLTATASGTINGTGLFRSGLVTRASGSGLSFEAVTAGTDIILTSGAGGVIASGALAAGHDVTINTTGSVNLSELDAGDDVTVNAGGIARIGAAYSYASGLDNEGNGSNIGITAGGALTFDGIAQSAGDVTLQGTAVTTQAIDAVGDVGVTATTGNIVANGSIGGFRIALDAAGDIDHAALGLLDADFSLTLDAGGNIRTGTALSGDDMLFNAGGAITTNALISDRNILLFADGALNLTGPATAGLALRIEASAVELNANAIDVNDLSIIAASGGVHSTGTIDVNGPVAVTAAGAVDMTGNMTVPSVINIRGASVTVGNVTGADSISLIATGGAVNSAGTIDAGRNIFISTTAGGNFNRLIAGDDIAINGSGNVNITFMDATGDNPEGEEIGSNVTVGLTGNLFVEHGEAADDYVVNATSFRTGLNSIIAGGDIDITTAGASDLGNSTAGGAIRVDAQSIAFNTLDAGATIDLVANGTAAGAEGIDGATIVAGGNIALSGNSIAISNAVTGDANFAATATGGSTAINGADLAGNISVIAAGNLTGTYVAGGDITLSSGANVTASARANGGYVDPLSNAPAQGNLFVSAAGNATLTNSGAGRMFGVNAGQAASITTATAGEDVLVTAGTTANLTGVTAGDDVNVRANGAITAQNVRTTGAGSDTQILGYSAATGFTIGAGEGSQGINGADIVMASSGGAINAGGLSAGDDILLNAATAITLNGATTLGLGTTGGDSSIRTQSANAVLGNLGAASDIVVDASGAMAVNASSTAGRDVIINAAAANIASLTNPGGDPVDTLAAGRDLTIQTAGTIAGGAMSAGRDLSLSAGSTIDIVRATTGAGGTMSLDAAAGITAGTLISGGQTNLTSSDGAILVGNLASAGPVTAIGDSVTIDGSGNLIFSQLQANVGNARITSGGNLAITAGTVAGEARLSAGGSLAVTQLDAADAILASNGAMTLGTVTADNTLAATAQSPLTVNGAVTGRTMSLASADITIGSAGRVGNGTTQTLEVRNIDDRVQTFIGGTGSQNGYHIDSAEMARLYGNDIQIFAPEVNRSGGRFIGTIPPDVVIDDFTMTAGAATSNLGANGSLTIATPGTARVVGDVALTGMGDNNALNIFADQSLEVIMGEGSIRLSGTSSAAPGGFLNLVSEDVIVATLDAIDDVAAATTIDAIDDRLAQNDGITSDDGALFAGGIDVGVSGGFYVQNSGTGTRFADRRGLTFGAGGLNVNVAGATSRIVINGVHLGPSGPVTGLNTIPLLSIDGIVIGSGPLSGSGLAFDSGSTMNGCLIVSTGACSLQEIEASFPVQDIIEEEVEGDDGDGNTLPQPLITMRDLDPLTGEPLLDDPVTGAGNDDLWTPPHQ